ncbi:MAG: Trm112 family protein [Holosporales bacterium]|nr:Trm112 family protein [Holosporales bacterium]
MAREQDFPSFDPACLDLLVCPVTKAPLVYDEQRQELISKQANLAYPIHRSGIPVLLPEMARSMEETIT